MRSYVREGGVAEICADSGTQGGEYISFERECLARAISAKRPPGENIYSGVYPSRLVCTVFFAKCCYPSVDALDATEPGAVILMDQRHRRRFTRLTVQSEHVSKIFGKIRVAIGNEHLI